MSWKASRLPCRHCDAQSGKVVLVIFTFGPVPCFKTEDGKGNGDGNGDQSHKSTGALLKCLSTEQLQAGLGDKEKRAEESRAETDRCKSRWKIIIGARRLNVAMKP